MTNQEWLQCQDPRAMIAFALKKRERKMRLAAVAACRLFEGHLADDLLREALEVAERYADRLATKAEQEAAWASANLAFNALLDAAHATEGHDEEHHDATEAAWAAREAVSSEPEDAFFHLSMFNGYEFLIAHILRDVFAPPKRVLFNPAWLTSEVTALAHSIYEERTFDVMPILADALEEAGCTDVAILEHCRNMEPAMVSMHAQHVRGCWVLDLILGKE
jgi:hypothetical protein